MRLLKVSKKLVMSILALLFSGALMAGTEESSLDMSDKMYASGKIYVVIVCLVLIFLGIVIYLITIDRKLNRLEKQVKNK